MKAKVFFLSIAIFLCVNNYANANTLFYDDFENGNLNNWTIGGRQLGTHTANVVVSDTGSLSGHLYQNGSFTEINMSRDFSFDPNDTFFFDMKVDVSSTTPPAPNYYGISGVAFNFFDSNDTILGSVWYLAATTNFPTTNWVSSSTNVNVISENVWHNFELDTSSLLSQITIDQAEIIKTQMMFEIYSSTWPNPTVSAELWVDNVSNYPDNVSNYPVPDIKANGSDSPVTLSQSDTLSITGQFNAGSMAGQKADWWVVAKTPFSSPNDWYHRDLTLGWMSGITTTYQGPLFDLNPYEFLGVSGLPIGTYTFYFGVDMRMNGSLDFNELYYDWVVVNIEEEPDSSDLTGTYMGSLDATATECFPEGEDDAFTLSGSITVTSPSQVGEMFGASGELMIHRFGFDFTLNISLSGTVTAEEELSGTYTETFVGTNGFYSSGNGTFTGSVAGNALSIQIVGQDTDVFGDTCVIRGAFTGSR